MFVFVFGKKPPKSGVYFTLREQLILDQSYFRCSVDRHMVDVTAISVWTLVSVVLQAKILYYFDSYFHGNFLYYYAEICAF